MKKSATIVSFAFILAASMYAQDACGTQEPHRHNFKVGQNQQGKMPQPMTVTGTVKIQTADGHQFATLSTGDGKEYALMVMQMMPRPGDDVPPPDAERLAPPAERLAPPPEAKDGQPPKMVTMEELAALDGKEVVVTGAVPPAPDKDKRTDGKKPSGKPKDVDFSFPKDGGLMVMSCTAK